MSCTHSGPEYYGYAGDYKRRKVEPRSGRSWCYTWNNYSESDIIRLEAVECTKHICSKEVGESGTPHLQGYIRFPNTQRFSWWKNQFPSVHVELRKGSEEAAWNYCNKGGEVVIEKGADEPEPPVNTKEDITLHVMEMIDQGKSLYKVRQAHPIFYFWNRSKIVDYKKDRQWWITHQEEDRDESC